MSKLSGLNVKLHVRKLFWFYFLTIVLLVTLPINSAGELNNITILRLRGDYFLHALLFMPWACFYRALIFNRLLWLLYGLLFAAGSEAVQYLLPYRAFNINDLVANVIGVAVGVVVVEMVQRPRGPGVLRKGD